MEERTETQQIPAEPKTATASTAAWPRITLVTAVRNGARYIEETIRSVVTQGYPNLEYIVVDGLSTDGTVEIIRKYEKDLAWWTSQRDKNVYEALNTGFAKASGEILGWLNASDMLHMKSLFVLGTVFTKFPEVEWITGRPTIFNTMSVPCWLFDVPHWSRYRVLAGANKYIQQESTFWRRSLWERAGAHMDESYRDAGDFELWVRFFRHAPLYSVDALIGGYRFHEDAMSYADREGYDRRCDEIIERELRSIRWGKSLGLFRRISRTVKPIPIVRGVWRRVVMKGLYHVPGPDWPPVIEYLGDLLQMKRR